MIATALFTLALATAGLAVVLWSIRGAIGDAVHRAILDALLARQAAYWTTPALIPYINPPFVSPTTTPNWYSNPDGTLVSSLSN